MDCTNGCRREEPSTPALKGFIWSCLVGITWVPHHHHMCLPSPFFPLKQFSNACKRKLPLLSKNIDEWPFSKTLGNVTRIFSFSFPQRTFVVVENLLMTWTNLRDLGSMILSNIFMWGRESQWRCLLGIGQRMYMHVHYQNQNGRVIKDFNFKIQEIKESIVNLKYISLT